MNSTHHNLSVKSTVVLPQVRNGKDAVFTGWQKTESGEVFALYNITVPGHPFHGSTVTRETLHKLKLQVPVTPLPQGPLKRF